jgi:hypothetical protein
MITYETIDLFSIAMKGIGKSDYHGLRMMELGDQLLKMPLEDGWLRQVAKDYFHSLGVAEHVSIDLYSPFAKRRGALLLDLAQPIDRWRDYFDLTTNFGTAEHIQDGIYNCFRNIHNFTKVGGAMLHVGPIIGSVPDHSPYRYRPHFMEQLGRHCGYEILLNQVRQFEVRKDRTPDQCRSLCAVFVKQPSSVFLSREQFNAIDGIEGWPPKAVPKPCRHGPAWKCSKSGDSGG